MTTEDLIALADTYARCNANYHVENLYGTSGSYTEDCARQQQQARQALLDALEALGREVARLTESVRYEADCVAAIEAERDTLRAELAAIRATQGQAASGFDVTIDDEPAKMLKAFLTSPLDGDDDPTPIRLLLGDGHSGYGLYLAAAEYPEEGAELLCSIASTTDKDAKRYRWWAGIVASGDFEPLEKAFEVFEHTEATTKEAIDAAIDAAMLAALPKLGGV